MTRTQMDDDTALHRLENFDPSHAAVRDRSAVDDIRDAVAARNEADLALTAAVRRARHDSVTWVEIAAALGVSHQAAIKRFKARL